MGDKKRRENQTSKEQEKFLADVKRRRETAYTVDNFLVDGETGAVFMSASKTAGGIQLIEEVTLKTNIPGFVSMIQSFLGITLAPELLAQGGQVPDGIV